ncbi:SDR family NAD(P)-dependent oxidoreductase [Streptomyces parvulus]|uniref:SDR family NAD(P)-dependent oxidoreductase n=1 Tax=Streptomyces parvulus TaxID=146923 RepID=UPI0034535B93
MSSQELGTVVVSGASSGFGRCTTLRLAEQGHTVLAVARRADRLAELVEQSGAGQVLPAVADVRDLEALQNALDKHLPHCPPVVGLVNNAGLSRGFGPMHSAKVDDWRQMVDTNVGGLLHTTALLLPRLIASGRGHIVNIGSIAASYPYTGGNVYAATKAFVHQLSLSMRTDLEGTGVRVSCIAPGMARTEFALVRYEGDQDRADHLYDGVSPLSAEDIAAAVLWCLSRPPHVNVNLIEIMPTDQPFGLGLTRRHA